MQEQFYNERASLLYDLAKAHNTLQVVFEDIQAFKEGVGGEMPFTQMMTRETITNSKKGALLKEIIADFHEETQQFFNFFIVEAEYAYIYRAIKHFEKIYAQHHLTITTALPLTPQQVERIVSVVSKKMNREIDTYTPLVDEEIIGGVRVKTSDFVIDTTLAKQLDLFRQEFRH